MVAPPEESAPRDESAWLSDIQAVARGDEAALSRLYDATSPLVYGLALRVLRDESAAEEVTLDVYTKVWRRAETFDPARGRPSTWLLTMARSRSIDRLRSGARDRAAETIEEHLALPDPSNDPHADSEASDQRRRINTALSRLSADQRQAIQLAFWGGLTHMEVAEKLGEPLGTVKTRIRSGMIKLRDLLRPLAQ